MGNNRQQLKEKFAQDLRDKIIEKKKFLTDLEVAFIGVQKNSGKVQGDVQTSFDELCQMLLARKLKLIAQIEELSLAQGCLLQEKIQQTYLELGSLQSTLFHIDSFDLSQFTSTNGQQFPQDNFPTIPPLVQTTLDTSALKNEINKWGNSFVNVSTSAPQSFVSGSVNSMNGKSISDSEVVKISDEPELASITATTKSNESLKKMDALDFDVDLWLSDLKSQTCSENEDFEMVFMDTEKVLPSPIVVDSQTIVELEDKLTNISEEDDSTNIIVCMDSDEVKIEDDLAKWLKPKKTKESLVKSDLSKWLKPRSTNDLSSDQPLALVPPEVAQLKFYSGPKTASKTQFLDYPCLRLDPKCWLHKKVPKENLNFNLDFSLTLSEKQIVPPSYSLPYPFWLKKY